jgi:geranylgeranyl diphosphate synthase type I
VLSGSSDESEVEESMDFVDDFLTPARDEINRELDEFFAEFLESIEEGVSFDESVDLATDEVVEARNRTPEKDMAQEIRRFTIPTFYDEAEEGDGPKRLRPATVGMTVDAALEFDLGQMARSAVPFQSKWDGILENPSEYDDPDQTYKENIERLSIAVELVHNFTLIHDDVNDGDRNRRTVDTSWVKRAQKADEFDWPEDEMKKGIDHAIQDGNLLRTLADSVIHTSDFTAEKKNEMLQVLNEAERNIIYGQNRDLWMEGLEIEELFGEDRDELSEYLMGIVDEDAEERNWDDPEELYLDMIDKKTVDLYVASVEVGAIAADADEDQRDSLRRYARNVGIPFQIRDDVLEIENASSISDVDTGKDSTDIPKGKTTLTAVTAYKDVLDQLDAVEQEMQQVDDPDPALESRKEELEYHRFVMEEMYGDEDLDEDEITEVADVIYQHESASEFYEDRLEDARRHLEDADLDGDIEPFMQFGEYLKDRDY